MPIFERVAFAPNYLGYLEGFELQKKVHAEVVAGKRADTVLLLEHQSVYTAGKRTELSELPSDGSEFVETNRGGKITWHGPGQLVGYPIMHLPKPIDVVGYVRYLEQVLIDSISEFGIIGIRVPGRTGVWVETERGAEKLASIGIRVAEKVTMHGFALNCSNSLEPFEHIVACGIADAKATTLSVLASKEITPLMAASLIEQKMGEIPNARG
ncbi:MAG: lipoyl(octanoyl) transferase LipB [Actinomycetota bacterium]|jgi:lipoyl(octanoyl) transferase